jgi:hypothetical protein
MAVSQDRLALSGSGSVRADLSVPHRLHGDVVPEARFAAFAGYDLTASVPAGWKYFFE